MDCRLVLLALPFLSAACAGGPPPKPVYLNRDVTTVAVLPPFSQAMDPLAWKTMWPHVVEGVSARGYQVVPVDRVDAFYAKNRFHGDPAEISIYSPVELAKEFQVDAVFYSNITRWSYQYAFIFSSFGVEAEFEMVDGRTEERLWVGQGSAVRSQGIEGSNEFALIGSLFAVAGNAFLNSTSSYARECVEGALHKFPHAGYDPELSSPNPGTNTAESQSDQEVPREPAEEPPVKKETPDP